MAGLAAGYSSALVGALLRSVAFHLVAAAEHLGMTAAARPRMAVAVGWVLAELALPVSLESFVAYFLGLETLVLADSDRFARVAATFLVEAAVAGLLAAVVAGAGSFA